MKLMTKKASASATAVRMKTKTVGMAVKAAGPDDSLEEGQFVGYASVFGNVDSYGDIVQPGAFTKTLEAWDASADVLSCLWAHDMSDPFSNLGEVLEAAQDDHGLRVKVALDLDNPKAAQIYRLAKGRRLTQMSFAYEVLDGEKTDDGYLLKELALYEVSLVPLGANSLTDVVAIKTLSDGLVDGLKAGRTLSGKNEQAIRDAIDILEEVLKTLEAIADEDDEATDDESDKPTEEPKAKGGDDPNSNGAVKSTTLLELELLQL